MKFEIDLLVLEMLDQLPETVWFSNSTTFLDPAIGGGQFVRAIEQRLREYGHSDSNIQKRVVGFEESDLHIRYAVNKHKLVGQYVRKPYNKFLEMDENMKFDVIIGNPPYQSSKENSDQLWPLFTEKVINLTKPEGYIEYIIPDTWTSGTRSVMLSGRKNLLTEVFNTLNVEYLNFDVKKYFPGIGSGFSAFVVQKSFQNKLTKFVTPEGTFDFDITTLRYIPKTINVTSLNIVKKVTNHNNECVYFKFYGKTDNVDLIDLKDTTHIFQYANTSSNHPTKWGDISGQGYGRKKVIYAYMGSNQKFEYDLTGNISLMYNSRAYELDFKATEGGLKSYFESKLVRFLNQDKWSQYNEPKILNLLPVVDFTKVWSDLELFCHFNLTQEEIDYIENAIK
jgi:site-specific DNA-methyltransferase (adenine-specific)